jgi:hypothetical protein
VKVEVDSKAQCLDPYVLDLVEHVMNSGETARKFGQVRAAKHHVADRSS